jgi:phosphoribosylanthranilate isomerase
VFRIKICGITTSEDAQRAAEAGADAIGLNFYRPSPRFVSLARAREIAKSVSPDVMTIGLFVNADRSVVLETADAVGLDMIQLHGDEPPSFLQQVAVRPLIRAFRCRDAGLAPATEYVEHCRAAGQSPEAVLLDAYAPGKYGGTGECLDWHAVRGAGDRVGGLPVVLAGGLVPENVGEAIAIAEPAAVDTASGVEVTPGRKDPYKLRRFVTQARAAFDRLSAGENLP